MPFDHDQSALRPLHHSEVAAAGGPALDPRPLQVGTFFGENRISCRRSGFILSDTHYPPELEVPYHFHEMAYFCLLLTGGYWEEYGRRRVTYHPFSIAFHPPHEVHHGVIATAGSRCFHVEIAPPWMERLKEHGRAPADALDLHSGEIIWLASRLYREFRANGLAAPLMIEGIILEMLGLLVRERSEERQRPRWLVNVVERLVAEFAQPLTVEEIAADLGVSPVRLSRAFRKFYGESVGEYQRRLRVQFACRRLADIDATLTGVGAEAGFADQSHFTRVFKRLTGVTPGEFKRMQNP